MQLDGLILNPNHATPMHRQLYNQIRQMVLSGALTAGTRMPSSRMLSDRLGVSRFTVVTALDQLVAEGYLKSVSGSGTFVETIPALNKPEMPIGGVKTEKPSDILKFLSDKANNLQWVESIIPCNSAQFLHMTSPDHRLFPHHIWSKLTKEVFAGMDGKLANYRNTQDELEQPSLLEQQIAGHIALSRGIKCEPEEVVITYGAHHAVSLLTELLLNPIDKVAFEEPGMPAIRSIFTSHGCHVAPMVVDELGPDPSTLTDTDVKLAFVTAAKQQPLTVSMPIKRKRELLNWAAENETIIVEDDLGSEFRYEGQPIPPLKAMDRRNQVIYIGAFSMSLLLTLRVGFMIMPKELAKHCRRLIRVRYRATPQITEQILARFIQDGHYSRHLHKTRRIYANRQRVLLNILHEDFNDIFEPVDFAAGFYNLCYFRDQTVDDDHVLLRCQGEELGIEQLSYYYRNNKSPKKGLLLGFASNTESQIAVGMGILSNILRSRS